MKPLYLTIEGINSFVEPQTVDFAALSQNGLFCICGPTGSGKTTVLDCIILALYAPRQHHRGSLRDYICTRSERGKISLTFSHEGKQYVVKREFRRGKETMTHLATLTCLDTGETLADMADTVSKKIESMIGLDKDNFTKVVVLEQGRFAEFMQMTPGERNKTVAKIFRLQKYEQLALFARRAKESAESELRAKREALAQYEGVTEEAHSAAKKEANELQRRMTALMAENERATEKLRALSAAKDAYAQAEKAKSKRAQADETLIRCAAAAEKLAAEKAAYEKEKQALIDLQAQATAARTVSAQLRECRADEEACADMEKEIVELQNKYRACTEKIKEQEAKLREIAVEKERCLSVCASSMSDITAAGYEADAGDAVRYAEIAATATADAGALRQSEEKEAQARERVSTAQTQAERFLRAEGEVSTALSAAQDAYVSANAAYEQARLRSEAAAVRQALHEGDRCPVCGGTYHGEHAEGASEDELAAKKEQATRAQAETERLREQLRLVQNEQRSNADALARAQATIEECALARGGKNAAAAAKAADAAKKASDAMRAVQTFEAEISKGKAETERLTQESERIRESGVKLRAEISALKQKISDRLGGLRIEDAAAAAQATIARYEQAAADAETRREHIAREEAEQKAAVAAAQTQAKEADEIIAAFAEISYDEQAYLDADRQVRENAQTVSELGVRIGAAQTTAASLATRLEAKKKLAAERKALDKREQLLTEFEGAVRGGAFFEFVAEEYVKACTEDAGDTLFSLTNGKYRLVYEGGEFCVADYFDEAKLRKVKTLSGGETFLASMSIAMAVSRRIVGSNYEFFFLDEGFGTLHEEAMETVYAALERLSHETAVGIVTHCAELAGRIASRLDVYPATETQGSRVAQSGI